VPSFAIASRLGIIIVKSCIMIEDVIYGLTLNANIDIFFKAPPESKSNRENKSLLPVAISLIPGTGI
jgi:hypothetical protein